MILYYAYANPESSLDIIISYLLCYDGLMGTEINMDIKQTTPT